VEQATTEKRPWAKFSSSGALLAKQRKRAPGRSQGPSPHPASSRDGDGAQNAAVLACCGLREARTRVRARAAYKVCFCVQYRKRENVLSESAPLMFPCFSCPEMNARPRRGDSEVRFHCADVTATLVQCHTTQNVTNTSAVSRLHAVADLAHHLVLGRPETGLTHARFARSRVEAAAAYRSFVSFEGSFWLFRWHLPAPDNG